MPAGVVAVIIVPLLFTATLVAGVSVAPVELLPMVTDALLANPVPVMVITVPPAAVPDVGEMPVFGVIEGGVAALVTVNGTELLYCTEEPLLE